MMGSPRVLSLWPTFSVSPVLTSFKWSPIVNGAVEKNLRQMGLSTGPSDADPVGPVVPDLVTLHIRRADFKRRESMSVCGC